MPELPEVETVRRGLERLLIQQPVLEKVELRRGDLRNKFPVRKLHALERQKVLSVGRRAKYLWFQLPKAYLISHLGMTGSWRPLKNGENLGKHDHAVLHFSGGLSLAFRDPRRFGILDVMKDLKGSPFNKMGPEPFSPEFSPEYLHQRIKGKKAPIKNAIMDQRVVVGIGNIYASEILFESRIRPARAAYSLTRAEIELLIQRSREVLHRSLEAGGSTLQDFVHTSGESGTFQDLFFVYDRAKKSCRRCQTSIKTKTFAGRSAYWCPKCQQ